MVVEKLTGVMPILCSCETGYYMIFMKNKNIIKINLVIDLYW